VNNGPLLFSGILATLASSFWGLLLVSNSQIGSQEPVVLEGTGELYPAARPGLAQEGAQVYRAQGCVECHSQRVRQTGLEFKVWLSELGTNTAAVLEVISQIQPGLEAAQVAKRVAELPANLFSEPTVSKAQAAVTRLNAAGASAQLVLKPLGPDIQRGWGKRVTVAQDFLRDYPVQIGSQRIGPDLANYGTRQTNATLILEHLYDPQKMMPGSMMPPYRFLFTARKLGESELPSTRALPESFVPGFEVEPKPEALALVAYLTSLRADVPLTNAPYSLPPTKAVPAATAATNAAPAGAMPVPK
jgi:cytochrome c oxidase cbb3-type subunit II